MDSTVAQLRERMINPSLTVHNVEVNALTAYDPLLIVIRFLFKSDFTIK